ncbi:MAG: hypothetical protein JW894_12610 [Bacteroidales bacterium]|nr:hypothetical protein [Bacteroidales bacterium]
MRLTRLKLSSIAVLIIITPLIGKTQEQLSLYKSSIEDQFNYVIRKSDTFEDNKVVKTWWLGTLKLHVLDSLKTAQDKITVARLLISDQNLKMDSLNSVIEQKDKKLKAAIKSKDGIRILGITTTKKVYNGIMWTLIILLAASLLIFILLFKRSNTVTINAKIALEETKEEFEAHRKRALAREQKITRELYDEVLKYKNKVKNS